MGHNRAGEARKKRLNRRKKELVRLRIALGMASVLPPLDNPAVQGLKRILGVELFQELAERLEKTE